MTTETIEAHWTASRLSDFVRARLGSRRCRLIAVSNREPYMHVETEEGARCIRPASGVTVALDPVMRAAGGTWVAHGAGSADRQTSDARGHLRVPPDGPCYTLRRVWLTKEEEEGYYYGFANMALWPLCHVAYTRPAFRREHWEAYVAVNRKFADAVVEEAGSEPALVFIQDYHFTLLPRLLRDRLPDAKIIHFWHIPWPNPEAFRICPWKGEILDGLLGNHLLGFHIQYHCNNFIDTIDRELEARPDREAFAISFRGQVTRLRPFPISVDFDELAAQAGARQTEGEMALLAHRHRLAGMKVAVAVDRIDYTKGIPERLRAVDILLRRFAEFRERFVLIQICAPSRTHIDEYQKIGDEIDALVDEINWRHKTDRWAPIVPIREHVAQDRILAFYRLAHVCLVTSLHDGMNLVAKEFVSSRPDGDGVLFLSRFTGSARELEEAILVNPYAVDEMAEGLAEALKMPEPERRRRMERLRERVREANVYRWAGRILDEAFRMA